MRRPPRGKLRRIARWPHSRGFTLAAYALFAACGVLVYFIPPTALRSQAGYVVTMAWATLCLAGGACGMAGLLANLVVVELIGSALSCTVSLTWAASLVLLSMRTHSVVPMSAACLIGALAVLLAQRWIDALRGGRE